MLAQKNIIKLGWISFDLLTAATTAILIWDLISFSNLFSRKTSIVQLFQPSEDTPIFCVIANTLGQFDPVHFWSLIILQRLNFLTYKNSIFFFQKLFYEHSYSCEAAVPPFFEIPERYFQLQSCWTGENTSICTLHYYSSICYGYGWKFSALWYQHKRTMLQSYLNWKVWKTLKSYETVTVHYLKMILSFYTIFVVFHMFSTEIWLEHGSFLLILQSWLVLRIMITYWRRTVSTMKHCISSSAESP